MNDYIMNLRLFGLGTLLLLSGCATIGPTVARDSDSADKQIAAIEEGVAVNEGLAAESRAVSRAMLDALTPEPDAEALDADPRFDLSVNGILSQEFFRGLVRDTPYNMVVHPDVNGQVSLDLKDVTVAEVMEIMRDVYSYDYERSGNLYRVYPNVLRTEVFQIDYLNVERKGSSEMQVSAGRVSDTRGSGSSEEGYSGLSASGVYATSTNRGGTVVGTKVNTDAQTNFWAELQSTLQTIIAGDEGSSIVVTPQVGLAVVRAKPDSLYAVRSYLSQVENTLHRQVIIEAKILEVTLKEGFEAGIDWNNFGKESGGTFYPTSTVDANGNTVVRPGSSKDLGAELVPGAAEFFNPLGSAFTFYASFSDFEITIDLLETQGSVQVLSSPRISTVNNQKAVIKVGSDEFFVTGISSTTTTGTTTTTTPEVELTPF
ncbi:MAG: secretin N-terminal domain-containing protein, partial [Pseudomonadales bacterium]|nr:secretin N-terminal domain-containing protein [Pseudomonadales bacterium]